MAKKLNQTRYTRAKLVVANIDSYGKHYAFEYGGADGLSIINVDPIPAPTDIKAYLEGNLSLSSYPVSSNITKLCAYALSSFPNLESVYLFKNDDLVELEQDAFFGLDNLDGVYVPEALYDSYVSTYPAYADLFKKIVTTMDLVVPTFSGVTKLTKEIFTQVVGMLESAKKNAIERVVVPAQYTELGTECFEAISQLTICDTIVLENITSAEADFMKGITSISYVQIENADFSLQGVADSTGTANFKWLTPIAYMHDYIYQDYVKDYYITGYAGITNGQAMPSREEYGYWKWYSSPATTDDTYLGDSETYPVATYSGKAYAFLMIDSLVLTGTGTLTSEIVENAINSIDTEISPLENVKRIIIDSGFTTHDDNCLDILADYELSDLIISYKYLGTGGPLPRYLITGTDYSAINVIGLISREETYKSLENVTYTGLTYFQSDAVQIGSSGSYGGGINFNDTNNCIAIFKNLEKVTKRFRLYNCRAFAPKLISTTSQYDRQSISANKMFIGNDLTSYHSLGTNKYCPATKVIDYQNINNDTFIGIIDGQSTYQNLGIYKDCLMNYPKLSATLTLDTSTGHLIENGTDLFTGYTATWYSDEDCTQVISDLTTITENTTAYVKLTVDPNYFSEVTVQGKSTPSSSGETIITKGFTSGGEHFTQLYIYDDGEIWYINGSGSVQAYANGVWEIEYKTLQFDSGVELTDAERIALLNNYDKI